MTGERRHPSRRVAAALLAGVAILLFPLLFPLHAQAADSTAAGTPEIRTAEGAPSRFAVGFDAAILRPLGFGALMVGCAAFVPVALITAPNGRHSLEMAAELLVTAPANDVFGRKLGDF